MIHSVDHPFIIWGQAVVAVAMIRLFFAIRYTPFPLPQLALGLSVSILANLVARTMNAPWFWISDIVMYWLLAAVIVAATFAVIHRQEEVRKSEPLRAKGFPQPAPVPVTDFFDKWQVRITWAFGLCVAGIVLYGHVANYSEKEEAKLDKVVAVTQENTKAKKDLAKQEEKHNQETRAFKDTLMKTVDTLKKTSEKLLDGQSDIKQGVKQTGSLIEKKSAQTRQTIRDQGGNQRTPEGQKTEKLEPKSAEPAPKRPWWKVFGRHMAQPDYSDTLSVFTSN